MPSTLSKDIKGIYLFSFTSVPHSAVKAAVCCDQFVRYPGLKSTFKGETSRGVRVN